MSGEIGTTGLKNDAYKTRDSLFLLGRFTRPISLMLMGRSRALARKATEEPFAKTDLGSSDPRFQFIFTPNICLSDSSHLRPSTANLTWAHPQSASLPSNKRKMTIDDVRNGHYSGSSTPDRPGSSGSVVQKFGGTSVGKFAREIVANVVKPNLVKHNVAVVCSAVSATVKAEGTTNR